MPGANYYTAGFNTSQKHTRISIFKIPKSKPGIFEVKHMKNYFFFFYETMF